MQLCNRDRVPLIFLQNITGFMVGKEYEHGGITKNGAKMLMVQSNLDVPKITLMTNGSFGAGNYAMCVRAFDARFLFAWPNSQISVMGMEQAAKTLSQLRIKTLERHGKNLSENEIERIYEGIKKVVAGNRIADISCAVQTYVEKNGFSVVRQFVGHGIGQELHEPPEIPNYV